MTNEPAEKAEALLPDPLLETWRVLPKAPTTSWACLVVIYPIGSGLGSCFPLSDGRPATIGRESDCEIRPDDPYLSRKHARVTRAGNGFQIQDLHSANGTFVNDVPVSIQKLNDGDNLRVGGTVLRYLDKGNVEALYHQELHRLSILDPLTGVYNRRCLLEVLEREVARSGRHRLPLSLLMLDVDRFKAVNDQLGHVGGDYVLRDLTACVQSALRKEDWLGRYGGEEFVAILPQTAGAGAVHLAERLRTAVEEHGFSYEGRPCPVTISLGVATASELDSATATEVLRRAKENCWRLNGWAETASWFDHAYGEYSPWPFPFSEPAGPPW